MRGHDDSSAAGIRIWLVEPHPLAARHLKALLLAGRKFRLLSQNEVLGDVGLDGGNTVPCVVVIDGGVLGGALDGYISSLRNRMQRGRILIIGPAMESADLCRLVMLGIRGFVPYDDVSMSLGPAIVTISRGRLWIPTQVLECFPNYVTSQAVRKKTSTAFTPREKLILNSLGNKLSNKEIALELNISERTVKFHLENIFSKLEVHDRHSVTKLVHSQHIAELLKPKDIFA